MDGKAAQLIVLHITVHMKGTEPITKVSSHYLVTSYLTKSPFLIPWSRTTYCVSKFTSTWKVFLPEDEKPHCQN